MHGDIKPSNLRMTFEGDLKIVNFGVAAFGLRRRRGVPSPAELVPALNETLPYMAPERHEGLDATEASDTYALGCLLWATLTGRPPYAAATEHQLVAAHLERQRGAVAQIQTMSRARGPVVRRYVGARIQTDRCIALLGPQPQLRTGMRIAKRIQQRHHR